MRCVSRIALQVILCAALGTPVLAQEAAPPGPFKAVHLVNLKSAADEATLRAALADLNAVVSAAGFPDIKYRIFKVTGKQTGKHNYLWESSWPSGAVYDKVHADPAWDAAVKKHPGMRALLDDDVYNRYVEIATAKP